MLRKAIRQKAYTYSYVCIICAYVDDLKAVTKRLIGLAKRKGSEDNISIIVVFLKDPRDIAAQNCPPMDLGLDNAVVNAPPFSIDGDACKITGSIAEAAGGDCANDNGVSDSDSEDLGPETAVDIDADDGDVEMRNHEPAPPTPPAHSVEESHIDGNLVDNVAESGEESEDEWNYYKGEGEPEQNPSEEIDEPPHSETPCQDNSAWESSSVDMNSSPLNPDAPVFVPGGVAGSDILLAESPRKPQPMEDIVVPDADQFKTELGGRPSEMQDLDNCDQLNGHHNISIDGITAHLNGNNKCDMDSFEFGVGIDSDKIKDSSIIHDFERIQKDTTDFCNIQVFQTHTETNPFDIDGNNDLLERLKNKERDPMSMSFYQEKDDDTCERFTKLDSQVDLNSLQPLPDSEDDDDIEANGDCQDEDKENVSPVCQSDLFSTNDNTEEPNNDIIRFDDRNDFIENNYAEENITNCNLETSNMQNDAIPEFECNINQESIVPTDTPESHKLLFEQIPEIPDGKSSELGFSNDELLDPTEREKDDRAITPQENIAQEQESEIKVEESEGFNPDLTSGMSEPIESTIIEHEDLIEKDTEPLANIPSSEEHLITPEIDLAQPDIFEQQIESNIIVDVHQSEKEINDDETFSEGVIDGFALSASPAASPLPTTSPLPTESSVLDEVKPPMPAEVPLPRESPAPSESPILEDNVGQESTLSVEEPECDKLQPVEESYQPKSPLPDEHIQRDSPITDDLLDTKPYESTVESEVVEDLIPEQQSPAPVDEAVYKEDIQVLEPVFKEEIQVAEPVLKEEIQVAEPVFKEDIHVEEPVLKENVHVDEIIESELPISENSVVSDSPIFVDKFERIENPIEPTIIYEATPNVQESIAAESPIPEETVVVKSPLPVEENDTQMIESKLSKEPSQLSPFPVNNVQNEMPVESQEFEKLIDPVPATETEISMDCNVPHEPIIEHRYLLSESAPAPDIVSEHARSELVTDIDIGIPESRAQEICVPVTNEIQNHVEEIPPATTPPPTPAVDLTEPPLSDVPIAAVAAATAAGAAVAAALAAKPKTSPVKKAPATSTTPTPRPKTVAKTPTPAKTPMSTTKRPTSTTTTPRTAATKPAAPKTPVSATAKTSKPAPKPASPTKAAPKPPAPVKEGPVTKAAPARTTSAPRPATKPAAPKPPAAKSTTSTAARPTTTAAPRVPAAKPTTRPVTAKTTAAPAKPPVAKTTAPATTKTVAAPKPKAPEKKPLMNGDAKPPAKPAPKAPAPAARPAPRLAPRPPVSAPAKTAPAKPPVRAPLDKQSKDLANKRITAKTAPPRTATAKSSVASKTAVKSVPKKSDSNKKEIIANGLNGSAELTKPSSPPVDNALLPDVIA
ncbi:unnamed protein product [Leptosia nina]|uniref:Uncharacterized protein n=1 Tax=Leptosia nina TaxID=320188 RepID=A0AAV1J9L0_9NEOP